MVTIVMREVVGSNVAATDKLSILYPRALNNPAANFTPE